MYIDPNTGGMLFQALAVLFGAITGGFLLFSSKIRMWAARMRRAQREKERGEKDQGEAS